MSQKVLYLSDGEYPGYITLDQLEKNFRDSGAKCEGYDTLEALMEDIHGAVDWPFAQGFWHGVIDVYNVCIISVDCLNNPEIKDYTRHG